MGLRRDFFCCPLVPRIIGSKGSTQGERIVRTPEKNATHNKIIDDN
jgi:hypothetical protein